MAVQTFENPVLYIESATTLEDRVNRLDSIIDALIAESLRAAGNQRISEYFLDDGQTKVRTIYRNTTEISNAIRDFEQVKHMYLNRLNGRVFNLRDARSIRYYNGRNITT